MESAAAQHNGEPTKPPPHKWQVCIYCGSTETRHGSTRNQMAGGRWVTIRYRYCKKCGLTFTDRSPRFPNPAGEPAELLQE